MADQPLAPERGEPTAGQAAVRPSTVEDESTVGTGSVFAVGCSIATVLLILLGVAVFVLLRIM